MYLLQAALSGGSFAAVSVPTRVSGGVWQTMKKCRLPGLLAVFALLAAFITLPAHAESYDTVLSRLSSLQSLAETYIADTGSNADPIEMALSYTRTGEYNSDIWTITAGARDPGFEDYVAVEAPELTALQDAGVVETPAGSVDFARLLASINLVYRGLPIAGSWGGDCMELAQQYAGQASDADGYTALMQGSFESDASMFGADDLRADLDAINIGAQLSGGGSIADAIQTYYTDLSDYDRVYRFIALSFGDVDTSDTAAFRQTVYETMSQDVGMQLLLYINGMMSISSGWTVEASAAPALQGACNVFADYLAGAVGGERVRSDSDTRMVTMAVQALSEALAAMGDQDAASAALDSNGGGDASSSSGSAGSGSVSQVFSGAASSIQSGFDLQVFETILLIVGAAALMLLIISIVMLVRRR